MSARPAPRSHERSILPGCLLLLGIAGSMLGVGIWAVNRQEAARKAADPLIGQVRTVQRRCAVSVRRIDGAAGYDEDARVEPEATVRITDHHDISLTVEIVDGRYKGRTGWLATPCLGA